MDIEARRRMIVDVLTDVDYITVEELSRRLGVSSVTIRTDLSALEEKGDLIRTHGGAMKPVHKNIQRMLSTTMSEFENEKKAIARRASSLISPGSTIIIDSGSTTIHLMDHLSGKDVSVITNSIPVLEKLKDIPDIDVLMLGGNLKRSFMGTMGPIANSAISSINVDTYFLGATNFDREVITCTNLTEAELKRQMIKAADKVVLLADSSKFGRKAYATICTWTEIDAIVTDKMDEEICNYLEDMGTEVITL